MTRIVHSSTPILLNAHQRTFLGTRSKAFSRSTNAMYSGLFAAMYFSCNWRMMKIASVVPRPGSVKVQEILEWNSLLSLIPMLFQEKKLDYMETFQDRSGRHYTLGYIVYSHILRPELGWNRRPGRHLTGYVSGRLTAMVNGETFYVGTDFGPITEDEFVWNKMSEVMKVPTWAMYGMDYEDFVQEPRWLFAFGMKAKGRVLREVFGIQHEEWSIKFLHFDRQQCQMISESRAWLTMKSYTRMLEDEERKAKAGPTMYRARLHIKGQPKDTFVRMDGWTKGIVIVNNFNLGRYWDVGPQRTLYLPAPLLKQGTNKVDEAYHIGPATVSESYLRQDKILDGARKSGAEYQGWTKGIVIVNNFNLGRYWDVGPQRTLYLPAPLLKQGTNEVEGRRLKWLLDRKSKILGVSNQGPLDWETNALPLEPVGHPVHAGLGGELVT
ncbi:hypothetical protein EGW08_013730 [Elysia chlorotica]|uniref:Beta-galactosidase galactose-binding domain-containing protein n=1 Tax=Elysia chlorotica TaxID=188477 RepID=A0A433TAD5_ELYCH|nr:hypothetical protein EGW08_013730 [Elysia chlorotica]